MEILQEAVRARCVRRAGAARHATPAAAAARAMGRVAGRPGQERDGPVPPEFAAIGGALTAWARRGWAGTWRSAARHGADAQGRDRGGSRGRADGASQFDHGAQCADRGGPGPVEDGVADRVDDARGDAVGHHLVVRRTLGGLRAAAEQAGRIDIDRRETRLPLGDVPEEAAALVRAVNGALARLDEGYARHQRFLADAAHELRTPIAILNMRLEALPAGPERARLLEDAARLSLLAGQLLDARSGWSATARRCSAGPGRAGARRHGGAGAAGRWRRVPDRIRVGGRAGDGGRDRPALERAVSNLVQNAIQHGGRRGVIARSWRSRGRGLRPGRRRAARLAGRHLQTLRQGVAAQHGRRPGPEPGGRIIRRHGAKFPWRPGRTAAPAFALIFLATPMSRPNSPGPI